MSLHTRQTHLRAAGKPSARGLFADTVYTPVKSCRLLPLRRVSDLSGTARRAHEAPRYRSRGVLQACRVRNIDWPEALLFDCDGVLVDTERDGHRVAFNQAFKEKGLDHEWSVELYGKLLEIGGGKERMLKYFTDVEEVEPFASVKGEGERWDFVKGLHQRKTQIFMDMVESGMMPLRPGVRRLVDEARQAGVKVAVCSTSNEKAVSAIVKTLLGQEIAAVMRVFAGDMVPKKKPDPAIYTLAAGELGVNPARCVVIEDSRIGLLAARAAGMRCVVTKSSYTGEENFDVADAVFDCIGDEGSERFSLDELTTPGAFWLNPPLPMDAQGNRVGPVPVTAIGQTDPPPEIGIDIDLDGDVPRL